MAEEALLRRSAPGGIRHSPRKVPRMNDEGLVQRPTLAVVSAKGCSVPDTKVRPGTVVTNQEFRKCRCTPRG